MSQTPGVGRGNKVTAFRDLSIRRKQTLIIMLTSTAALLLASAAFVTYELVTFRDAMAQEVSTLAGIIGENCKAALSFDDQSAAEQTLAAVAAEESIVAAAIYTADDLLFARYRRGDAAENLAPTQPGADGPQFEGDYFYLFQGIFLDEERIGTVYVQSGMQRVYSRLRQYGVIVFVVFITSTLLAFLLSSRLQRVISEPILDLVRTTKMISEQEDYSVRATKPSEDEVGMLIESFNEMLTRIQERDAALVAAKAEAEAATRAKSEFLSRMSHELRTPLNSVIGFTNILLKNQEQTLSEQDVNYLERISNNGVHLLRLINDILDLAKVEAGRMELEITPVSVGELVQETIQGLEVQVRGTDVELRAELPESMALIRSDRGKLKQVLINLVGNAIKFTEAGHVTVRVEADSGHLTPVRIDITDTGAGIPEDRRERVFEPFIQADTEATHEQEGTGLGLSIARSLCALMGYRLEVDSRVGVGSTFSIVLAGGAEAAVSAADAVARPLAVARVQGTDTAEEIEPPVVVAEKVVLVIDDDLDSRTLLEHYLEDLGCQVMAAATGEEGLRMAGEFRPDLITLDLVMPEMSGWEVLRELKADQKLHEIPVVIVSIVAKENQGRLLGAMDLLDKPTSREDLRRVLERNLMPESGRVLVVDDEEDARQVVSAYLEDEAVTIRTANNGAEALEVLETFLPDLIILDLLMPVMDGMTFLEAFRKDPRYLHVPVVVVTAKEITDYELGNLEARASRVLMKGEQLEEDLRLVVREVLHRTSRA